MIMLTNMRGEEFILNCDLIETIHSKPDTTIHMTNGNIMLVREEKSEVVQRIIEFRRAVFRDLINGKF